MTKKNNKLSRKRIWLILTISVITLFSLFIGASVYLGINIKNNYYGKLPEKKEIQNIENAQATEIFTADGKLMGRFYLVNRNEIEFDNIPDNVIHALIATEDARFFEHSGIDYRSLFRVFFKTILLSDRSAGGGSTITQQLAKNLYPRKGEGLPAILGTKIREMIIALRIEDLYSKEEIIQLYLNTIPFGENTYGLKNAAQLYFNKNPQALSINQAATLIGMLKATTTYNPHDYPERSVERRNIVLNQMQKYHYISGRISDSLKNSPLKTDYTPVGHNEGIAPYFREYLRPRLENWCSNHKKDNGENYNLYTDGLKIYTTIHSEIQESAYKAVHRHIPKLQKQLNKELRNPGNKNKFKTLAEKLIIKTTDYKRKDLQSPNSQIYKKRPMEVFTWDGPETKLMSRMDSIQHYIKFLQTGFTAINPKNGNILAWIGGINHRFFKYDHVTSKRQMGSVFKPIVYTKALQSGIKPCDFYSNDSIVYKEYDNWTPANADRKYGGVYSVQGALINSVNTVSVQLMMEAGIKPTIKFAKNLGFKDSLPGVPSLALGAASTSVLNLAEIYTAYSNKGTKKSSSALIRIEDNNGNLLEQFSEKTKSKKVIAPAIAEKMTLMLENVIQRGTGSSIKRFKFSGSLAGKTGTTQNHSDGWFMGYTPSLVTVCWVGADYPEVHFKSLKYGQGAATALPITGYFLQDLSTKQISTAYLKRFRYKHIDFESFNCMDYREKAPGLIEKLFGIKLFKGKDSVKKDEKLKHPKKKKQEQGFFKRLINKFKGDKDKKDKRKKQR